MQYQDFERDCRVAWYALLDGQALFMYLVDGMPPTGLPSTTAHVIIIQGSHEAYNSALLHGHMLPPLMKTRAVLFSRQASVSDFFVEAQVDGACTRRDFHCYVKFSQDGVQTTLTDQEHLQIPMAKYVEGDVMIVGNVEEHDDDSVRSEASTSIPMTEDEFDEDQVEDAVSLMSAQPHLVQVDHENRHPWETAPFEDFDGEMEDDQGVEGMPIAFAPQHDRRLLDTIQLLQEGQEMNDQVWIAATFGLGLIDLGRRDIHFHPDNLQELLDSILEVWGDHAQYGDLLVYTVYPQPVALLGLCTVALIVQVDFPEARDPTVRCALINEQSAEQHLVRTHPYAARLMSGVSEREILTLLELHRHCHPFTLRDCHVRVGVTIMQPNQQYELEDGILCRPWIGRVPEQIQVANERVSGVTEFFLQVRALREQRPELRQLVGHVHGPSPAHRPLGSRTLVWDIDWLYDLDWIDQMETLWPFEHADSSLVFVPTATPDMREQEEVIFHFIRSYGLEGRVPILVNQQMISVDELQHDPKPIDEFVAAAVPQVGDKGVQEDDRRMLTTAFGEVCQELRRQSIQPFLEDGAVQEASSMDDASVGISSLMNSGNSARPEQSALPTWCCHFIKRTDNSDTANEEDQKEYPIALQVSTLRSSKRGNTDPLGLQDSNQSFSQPNLREGPEVNLDLSHSQGDIPIPTLRECNRDNMDPVDSQGTLSLMQQHKPQEAVHKINEMQDASLAQLQGELNYLLDEPWKGLNTDFTILPDMHPIAQVAQQSTLQGDESLSTVFHIFTDGSYGRGVAAWSFVLLAEWRTQQCTKFVRIGYAAGLVTSEIGKVTQSAHDAEATALIAAAEYLLTRRDAHSCEINLHFDALATGKGSSGYYNQIRQTPDESERQAAARLLLSLVQRRVKAFAGLHVHAHDGQPWNEMADSLAGQARRGWSPMNQVVWKSAGLLRHPLRNWAWLMVNPTDELPHLQELLRNEQADSYQGYIDSVLQDSCANVEEEVWHAKVKIATVNVGTLQQDERLPGSDVSCKTNELLQQFQEKNFHFIGVQEGRARYNRTVTHGPFTCFVSTAQNGVGGVELWINTASISETFQLPFEPTKDVCVWHTSPRLLMTRCHIGALTLEIAVGYAPQRGRPSSEIVQWWNEVRDVLGQARQDAACILLGDFNCKLGSVTSQASGTAGADLEDVGGALFRERCQDFDFIIPSTMDMYHHGSHWTFRSPLGHTSRLDFIALSAHCAEAIFATYVDEDIDVLNGDRDHRVLAIELSVKASAPSTSMKMRKPLYDRDAARNAMKAGSGNLLLDFEQCPWSDDVNFHWSKLRDHMQLQASAHFPKGKRQKRQLYFSQQAWDLVCYRKDLRQEHRALQRGRNMRCMPFFFAVWKDGHVDPEELQQRELEEHLCAQQEAVVLEMRRKVDRDFRKLKKQEWKNWVEDKLENQIAMVAHAKATEVYRILKPKKMVDRKKGKHRRPLPGLIDHEGQWRSSRSDTAWAWDRQFAKIEHAEKVTFDNLMKRSVAKCTSHAI
eukprot:s1783_g10.t1